MPGKMRHSSKKGPGRQHAGKSRPAGTKLARLAENQSITKRPYFTKGRRA